MDKILKMFDDLFDGVETSKEAYELYNQISEMADKFYKLYEFLMEAEEEECYMTYVVMEENE